MHVLALIPPAEAIWPTTASGWVALVASLLSLVTVVVGGTVAYGKWLNQIDGFGSRLGKVEEFKEQATGADVERRIQLDRIQHDHTDLIVRVGEAKEVGAQCREDAIEHQIVLGSRVADLDKKVTTFELSVSQRLTATETDIVHLKEKRQ